jgi:hypothetical protein
MTIAGYDFDAGEFARLLIRKSYPERSDEESAIIRDWLVQHLHEYDRVTFSVRVGQGLTPDPEHLAGVQRNTVFSTRKRIDVLAWRAGLVDIIECKVRVTHQALGQLLTYRQLLLEEQPELDIGALITIGRTSDDDTIRALNAHGVTVLLYAPAPAE